MYSSIKKLNLGNQMLVQFWESMRKERSGRPLLIISACSPELASLDTHWKLTWLSRAPGSLLTGSACHTKGRVPEDVAYYLRCLQHWSRWCIVVHPDTAAKLTSAVILFTVIVCFSLLLSTFCTGASPWQNLTWRYSEKGILPYVQCRGYSKKGWQWCQGDNRWHILLFCYLCSFSKYVLSTF